MSTYTPTSNLWRYLFSDTQDNTIQCVLNLPVFHCDKFKKLYFIEDFWLRSSVEWGGFPYGTVVKESAWQCRRLKSFRFDPWVGKIPWCGKRQPCSSILAWRIPWIKEPGGPQSKGLQRIRQDWAHTYTLPF